jgi:prepilin-type processing-associated H-X9-DG protein
MLATMTIILILFLLYWEGSSGGRAKRERLACQQNLERGYMAMQIYANDNAGKFPVMTGARTSSQALQVLVPKYTVDTAPFICPISGDAPLPDEAAFRRGHISYAYYMGRTVTGGGALMSDRQAGPAAGTGGKPLFSTTGKPPGNNHGKNGGNLLFCDGHVEGLSAAGAFDPGQTNDIVLLNPE